MTRRVLVAGVGNIFLGDDGFGSEVIRRLAGEVLPDGVRLADFGVGSVHLAYELADGYDAVVLVDASPRGGRAGDLYVIEPELDPEDADAAGELPLFDPHSLTPDAVLTLLSRAGDRVGRVMVVGCEPASIEEGIGLSEPVAAAVEGAAALVRELTEEAIGARARPV